NRAFYFHGVLLRLFVLGFAFGTWLLQQQATLAGGDWLICLALAGIALLWLRTKAAPRALIFGIAGAALGFVWAASFAHWRMADRLDPDVEGRDVTVTGVVASLPQPFERGVRFDFDVEHSGAPLPDRIALSWYNGYSADEFQQVLPIRAGERWRLTVRLKRPHGNANPHGSDYELWLLERGIGATGYVRPRTERAQLDAMVYRPAYIVERMREQLRAKFRRALPDAPFVGVLIALAVGDQRAIPQKDWETYTRTGVSHLVSISGLHVTMISALCAWAVYSLWRQVPSWTLRLPARKAAALAALFAALAYCLLAGFAVPAQRTLYMVAVVAVALYFDRLQSSSRVLCWALLLVLLLDPWAITAPGFWLSFGAVALMLHVGVLDSNVHWLKRWTRVQWAITIGLAPLLLILFQQVSLVSPIANAIAIPVVSFVVTPLVLLAAVVPGTALLHAAHWVMEQLMRVLELLAAMPGAVWAQHTPLPWTMLLAMVGIAWMLGPRGLPARYCGFLFLLPLFALKPATPLPDSAWIEVLDVGQGLAVVVRTAHHDLVYDTGPAYSAEADAGNRVVLPYLRANGVSRLDSMVVTHEDKDHAGGALSIAEALPIDMLWSSLPDDHPVLGAVAARVPCRAGTQWEWDGVRFEFFYPPMTSYLGKRKPNSLSCVLKISSGAYSMLLTGDIEASDEKALLEAGLVLGANVLLMPHHGSNTSSTAAFVSAVKPQHVVAAAGYRNRFGHPRAEVLARYAGTTVWRTDRDGAVEIRLDATGFALSAFRKTTPRYWRD
ncbi:MAG TPA: DNA internalization-related competence protein ComEC/Rec2, partial [Burkholderiales bacterium]|nr:DNA internalization-related competence protein ComEC/Rec2 [Burkholderiales bacterium]